MLNRHWAVLRTTVVVLVGLVLAFVIDTQTGLNRLDRWFVVIAVVVALTLVLERARSRLVSSPKEPSERG